MDQPIAPALRPTAYRPTSCRSLVIAVLAVTVLVAAAVGTLAVGAAPAGATSSGTSNASVRVPPSGGSVWWMPGYQAPGTPKRLDKVGVLKIGPAKANNVLVLEPGTSAGSAYFVPLAKWLVSKLPGWQVWSVERRENLLEDQSMLNRFKEGKAGATQLYDYYLGYLKDPSIKHHFTTLSNSSVAYAKQWGMKVAVLDLHRVIEAAGRLGGKVVLGGHSLGGAVVTAYATWDFGGNAGAGALAGLVYIDGASGPAETSAQAQSALEALDAPSASPWLSFGGIPAPYAGIFVATGSASAVLDPNAPSLGQSSGLLPSEIVPSEPVTNLGQFGYALNVATSPPALEAAQAHLGTGLSSTTYQGHHSWNGAGALTPIKRFATMFSGYPLQGVDGSEWYFPQRLTDDTAAVDNGNANPAQTVLGLDATMGHRLPKRLLMYAFATHLGGQGVLDATSDLAKQSGIPASHLTLINRQSTYAHNDPAGAYPNNVFFSHLVPFLRKVAHA